MGLKNGTSFEQKKSEQPTKLARAQQEELIQKPTNVVAFTLTKDAQTMPAIARTVRKPIKVASADKHVQDDKEEKSSLFVVASKVGPLVGAIASEPPALVSMAEPTGSFQLSSHRTQPCAESIIFS